MKNRILSLALVVTSIAFAGCGDSTDAPSSASNDPHRPAAPAGAITVTAVSYKFTPTTVSLKVGREVTLFVTNDSTDDHDIKSDIPISGLHYDHADNVPSEIEDNSKGNVFDVDFSAGGYAQVSFTPTKAGTYEFHCDEEGHKDKGMVGSFVVAP